jgi:hypothetical protein
MAVLLTRRSPLARSLGVGLALHFALDLTFGEYRAPELSLVWRARRRMRTGWMGNWVEWPRGSESWKALVGRDRR